MKSVFTLQAAGDVTALFDYVQERHTSGAQNIKKAIYASIGLLESLPYIGVKTDIADVRMLPVSQYPYLIFYTIQEKQKEVVVLSIRHASRQR